MVQLLASFGADPFKKDAEGMCGNFDIILFWASSHAFLSPNHPFTRAVTCSTWCPCCDHICCGCVLCLLYCDCAVSVCCDMLHVVPKRTGC